MSYIKTKKRLMCAVMIAVLMTTVITNTYTARADTYDDQIKALEAENGTYQSQISQLQSQVNTLQNKVSELQAQGAMLQNQINLSQAQYDQLTEKINQTQVQIKKNKDALGKIISELYVSDNVTPIEMIASSKNIGDYLDKQEYRSSVRNSLASTITKITSLKKVLSTQQEQISTILQQQKAQKMSLDNVKQQQQELLDETQGQESTYQSIVSQNQSSIGSLRAQQAAVNRAKQRQYGGSVTSGDPSHGGYPTYLDNAAQDHLSDPWGMFNRECVSYAAWKVHSTYNNMPYWGGEGNANQWPSDARGSGFTVSSTPKKGSVAIMMGGATGHAAWVESYDSSSNTIHVSQYNWNNEGEYTEMTVSASLFDYYIYFGG
jgi:peptidoglycan hydrolase CwlO-like protein